MLIRFTFLKRIVPHECVTCKYTKNKKNTRKTSNQALSEATDILKCRAINKGVDTMLPNQAFILKKYEVLNIKLSWSNRAPRFSSPGRTEALNSNYVVRENYFLDHVAPWSVSAVCVAFKHCTAVNKITWQNSRNKIRCRYLVLLDLRLLKRSPIFFKIIILFYLAVVFVTWGP